MQAFYITLFTAAQILQGILHSMKITKYEHACMVLEDQGKKIVIDPGVYSQTLGSLDNIVAVVITHVHHDHFSKDNLQAIINANPEVVLYTTEEVAHGLTGGQVEIVHEGVQATAGPFVLRFMGEFHALIYPGMPRPHNTAVWIDDTVFYPGDSFTMPDKPVQVLAVPANAPWTDVGETIDYITQVKAARCFPVHNGFLSDDGNQLYNQILETAAKNVGSTFTYLKPGESLDR
jgi:L-ascorbate metabolism protein UlaG (beta-lactamase superfamily)